MTDVVRDLVYADYHKVGLKMLGMFPDAVVEDASDFIHRERFEISIPGIAREDWWKALADEGVLLASFDFLSDLEAARKFVNEYIKAKVEE